MKKFNLLAISIAVALTGCSDDDSSDNSPPVGGGESATFSSTQVIDGYIKNAQVSICETPALLNCTVIGNTDERGFINFEEVENGFIKAEVIAGQSEDSDKVGYVSRSYNMSGSASVSFVNPFTTVAHQAGISVEELAAEIGVSSDKLISDYVGVDSATHLLARTVASKLSTELAADTLVQAAKSAQQKIAVLTNQDVDLDSIELEIEISDDGSIEVSETVRVQDIASFLERTDSDIAINIYSRSIDPYFSEDTRSGKYQNGNYVENSDSAIPTNYIASENTLVYSNDDGEFTYDFFYLSKEIALGVSDVGFHNNFFIYSTENLDEESDYSDLTWLEKQPIYFISDDSSDGGAAPVLVKMTFGSDDKVVIGEEGGESQSLSYALVEGAIYIDFPEGDNDLSLKPVADDENMVIWYDSVRSTYAIGITEESLAEGIVQSWVPPVVVDIDAEAYLFGNTFFINSVSFGNEGDMNRPDEVTFTDELDYDGNSFSDGDEGDQLLYASDEFAFAVPTSGLKDLIVYVKDNKVEEGVLSSSDLSGQTFYVLQDDNHYNYDHDDAAEPILIRYEFSDEDRGTISIDGEGSWFFEWTVETVQEGDSARTRLTISTDVGEGAETWHFYPTSISNDDFLFLVEESGADAIYAMPFGKSEELTKEIFDNWVNLQ